jgi:hypothetical protein
MDLTKIIMFYIAFQAIVFIGFLIVSKLKDKRLKTSQGKTAPPGYVRTEEIMIDPASGKRLTVYYHPESGSRYYQEE